MAALADAATPPAPNSRAKGPLSYSSFHTYEDCPQRWKFLYIDEIPEAPRSYFSFGRSMHSALEALVAPLVAAQQPRKRGQLSLFDFHEGEEAPLFEPDGSLNQTVPPVMSLEEFLATYERVWVNDGFANPDEERKYFETGRDLLKRYHALFLAAVPRPIAVERRLVGRMDGIPIHGILDRIDLLPSGGLEIIDYKTSRELSLRDALRSEQLSFYQVLVESNYDAPLEVLTLYHLRSLTPLKTPPRGKRELGDLFHRVATVAEGIARQSYPTRVGAQCSRCEFKAQCPAFAKTSGKKGTHP